MKYPQTVQAANAVSTDRKALAEALLVEIPPRREGRPPKGTPKVADLLAEAAAELADAGHDISAATLTDYRNVAAWVAGNSSDVTGVSWQPIAWSCHYEAFRGGMSYATFAAHVESGEITGVDSLRRLLGKPTTRAITSGEKVSKVLDAIAAGEVDEHELHELRQAVTPSTGSAPSPGRISDRGKTREQLDDDAYWTKVRAALHLLLDVKVRVANGDTVPGDIAILLQILVPESDWDEALRDEIGNLS